MSESVFTNIDTSGSISLLMCGRVGLDIISKYINSYKNELKPNIIGLTDTDSLLEDKAKDIKGEVFKELLLPEQYDYVLLTEPSSGSIERSQKEAAISEKALAAIELLKSWYETDEEDEKEQRESLKLLEKSLNDDRPSNRKLF